MAGGEDDRDVKVSIDKISSFSFQRISVSVRGFSSILLNNEFVDHDWPEYRVHYGTSIHLYHQGN